MPAFAPVLAATIDTNYTSGFALGTNCYTRDGITFYSQVAGAMTNQYVTAGGVIYDLYYLATTADEGPVVLSGGAKLWAQSLRAAAPGNLGYSNVKWYGAAGDGVTDDTAAFVAALAANNTIYVPDGSYKLTSKITLTAGKGIEGQSRTNTILLHGYNGVMFDFGDGTSLKNITLDGQSGGFTGTACDLQGTAGRQTFDCVKIYNFDGACIYFATGAGSQSSFMNVIAYRWNAASGTGRHAIVIDPVLQVAAVPRAFSHIETGGQCSFDLGGCNDTFISNCFLSDILFTDNTQAVHFVACRIAPASLVMTIKGHGNSFVACDQGPVITIAASTDGTTILGTYNNPPVLDLSGNGRNQIFYWSVPYTCTVTNSGGTFVLGNGTVNARMSRTGNMVNCTVILTVGGTTVMGNTELRFSLPTENPNVFPHNQLCGIVQGSPTGAGAGNYAGYVLVPGALQYASLRRDTTIFFTGISPGTFLAGNVIQASWSYQVG